MITAFGGLKNRPKKTLLRATLLVGTMACLSPAACIYNVSDPYQCGANAYWIDGVCECLYQYSGDPYGEGCSPRMEWSITDECDDGLDVEWRLFGLSEDPSWVWPSASTAFTTTGLGNLDSEVIECTQGELICYGAQSGDLSWGLGLEGDLECDDCCYECYPGLVDIGYIRCESGDTE